MDERTASRSERRGWSVRTSTIVAGVLVPIAVEIGAVILAYRYASAVFWYGNFSSQALCSVLGLGLLARQFRWRVLLLAIVYLPVMFVVLVYVSLIFAGLAYGDSL